LELYATEATIEEPTATEAPVVEESQPIHEESWDGYGIEIVRATRTWLQYGMFLFAVLCIVIGAVEALFGR
jgi:hypothetical protein